MQPNLVDRWIVTGRLLTLSSLEIRTGDIERTRPAGNGPGDGEPAPGPKQPDILAMELDVDGRPVIPGTALKGKLRALLVQEVGDAELDAITRLFGDRPQMGRDPAVFDAQAGIGGAAEFRTLRLADAPAEPAARPPVLGKTAIHQGTGTAADALLRHGRVVAEETAFGFEIVVDGATEADVRLLCHALRRLDGRHEAAFGARQRAGQGRVALDSRTLTICHLGPAAIQAWLADQSGAHWMGFAVPVPLPPAPGAAAPAGSGTLPLRIAVEGFFLVTRAQPPSRSETDANPAPREPRTVRRAGVECPLLPGESLNGVLRAQAMRIWRTLHGKPSLGTDGAVPEPVEALFGSTRRRGRLSISDFVGAPGAVPRVHEMVAIDRFHGASSGTAKFRVMAFDSPVLEGSLRLDAAPRLNQRASGKDSRAADGAAHALSLAAFGLLVLVLRDLAEGDLAAGFGTRKGYGQMRLTPDWPQAVQVLADGLGYSVPDAVAALRAVASTVGRVDASLPPPPPAARAPVPVAAAAAPPGSFVHAYHFVPIEDGVAPLGPDGSLDLVHARDNGFGHTPETQRDGHAIYADGSWSGCVTCSLTALHPFIVGGERHADTHDMRKYPVLQPALLGNEPAIPATSLKGMVSAIIEGVSRSALRVLHDIPLGVRVPDKDAEHGSTRKPLRIGSVHALFTAGDDRRRDLLPMSEHRRVITPAERMFGFVPLDEREADGGKRRPDRIRAVAGRLRFGNARLERRGDPFLPPDPRFTGERFRVGDRDEEVGRGYHRLRELAGPLKSAKGDPSQRNASAALYYRRPNGSSVPISATELAAAGPGMLLPQGRKFYVHGSEPNAWFTRSTPQEDRGGTPGKGGPAAGRKTATRLVKGGERFGFRIAFDNLSSQELGLLLFALRPSDGFRHKIGLGKPIGLGSVHLVPERLAIVDRLRRYTQDDPLTAPRSRDETAAIPAFVAAARGVIEAEAPQALAALLAIGETHGFPGGRPAAAPVFAVPPTKEQAAGAGTERKGYEWFRNNTDLVTGGRGQMLPPIVAGAEAARRALRGGGAALPTLQANSQAMLGESGAAVPTTTIPAGVRRGKVTFYNRDQGFGLISSEDGGPDVLLPAATLRESGLEPPAAGTRVTYESLPGTARPRATRLWLR